MIYLYIYLIIAGVISLFLARKYWIKWRESPSKYNVTFQQKQANRMVDSYVFIVAYVFYVLLFPLAVLEVGINLLKKRG